MISTLKKYAEIIIVVFVVLIVGFFVLNLLNQHAPGVIGNAAKAVAEHANGQAYGL